MYGYSILFPPPKQQLPEKATNPAVLQQADTAPVKTLSPSGQLPSPAVVKPADTVKDITVETDVFRAEFSTLGGGLKKLTLKRYKDQVGSAGKEIILINEINQNFFTLSSEYPGFASAPVNYSASSANLSLTGAEKNPSIFLF